MGSQKVRCEGCLDLILFLSKTTTVNDKSTAGRFDPKVFVNCVQDGVRCLYDMMVKVVFMAGWSLGSMLTKVKIPWQWRSCPRLCMGSPAAVASLTLGRQ